MKVNGKPIIIVNEANSNLKDTQSLKSSLNKVTEKAKSTIENLHLQQKYQGQSSKGYTTKFRETLFNMHNRMEDTTLFRQNHEIMQLQSKNPQTIRILDTQQSTMHDHEEKKSSPEMAALVDKLFKSVEKKLQVPEFGGIVEEALKCSIFGEFGKTFKEFLKHNTNDSKQPYLDFFRESNILVEDLHLLRALLYFNLPYETIVKD